MKCTECPKYSECVMTSDLRRKRRSCTYAKDKKPMTNYDRIRNMSVEEMADLLDSFSVCSMCRKNGNNCFPIDTKEWLEREAK